MTRLSSQLLSNVYLAITHIVQMPTLSPYHLGKVPVDVNISVLPHLFDIVLVEHAGLEQIPPRRLSGCHVSSLERDQMSWSLIRS
jgi:hypothetical protein